MSWHKGLLPLLLGLSVAILPARGFAEDPSVAERLRALAEKAAAEARRLAGAAGAVVGKVVDWGKAAIDWTKKKLADLRKTAWLFVKRMGIPYIRRLTREGKEVFHRLLHPERRRKLLTPRPDVPDFLKALQQWREQHAAGGAQ
jgi:hypothetical protein